GARDRAVRVGTLACSPGPWRWGSPSHPSEPDFRTDMNVARYMASTRTRTAGALALGAFLVGLAPLSDGDLWWHLAAGREIVRTHALPVVDTFSSGAAGRPWIDVHWGFQLAAYGVHAVGGLRALVMLKCALV